MAIVIGTNRDEGRTFQQGSIGGQEADYSKWINETFGEKADKVLAQYPWPKDADKYTGAYLAGAVVTDSGHIAGIGGCAALKLTQDFAKYAPVYAERAEPVVEADPDDARFLDDLGHVSLVRAAVDEPSPVDEHIDRQPSSLSDLKLSH